MALASLQDRGIIDIAHGRPSDVLERRLVKLGLLLILNQIMRGVVSHLLKTVLLG